RGWVGLDEQQLTGYQTLKGRAADIQNRLYETAGGHRLAAEFWNKVQFRTGLPAALVAAMAGVSVVANQEFVAGVLGLAAAGLSALGTFSRPIDRFRGHDGANHAYLALADQINNVFLRAGTPTSHPELERLWTKFEDFQKRESALNTNSPYLPTRYIDQVR